MAYFSERALALINAHRKPRQPVWFCFGYPLSDALPKHIASRLKLTRALWSTYLSCRDTTRRGYLTKLYRYLRKSLIAVLHTCCRWWRVPIKVFSWSKNYWPISGRTTSWSPWLISLSEPVWKPWLVAIKSGQTLNALLAPAQRDALEHLFGSSDNQTS